MTFAKKIREVVMANDIIRMIINKLEQIQWKPKRNIFIVCIQNSERADTDMYRLSADISVIGRYIGFADKANAYRYRLSVSADKPLHIGF